MKTTSFKIVEYHESDDCGGDYWGVALFLDNKKLAAWGDDYHDRGSTQARAFAQGYATALNTHCNIVDTSIVHEFDNDMLYGGIK